jgi:hypothetical protein
MDIVVEEMLETDRFDICIPLHNGVWLNSLDLVCRNEVCEICPYSIWTDDGLKTECYFSNIGEDRVKPHLIKHHPRKILSLVKHMQLPEDDVKNWQKEIQKYYSIEEYPELWV